MLHCNKSVPQGCNTVKTRLARAFIPLKPAPAQKSSSKQMLFLELMDFSNVLEFEKVYYNDDITFFSCILTFAQALM